MARKHNTKHNRGQSKYPQRLKMRGMSSAAVRMEDIETLRKRQGRATDSKEELLASLGLATAHIRSWMIE